MYSQPSLLLAANPKVTETDWPDLVGYTGLWVTPGFGLHPPFYESTLCALSSKIMSLAWKSLEHCEICSLAGASPLSLVAGGVMGMAHMGCTQAAAWSSL